MQILHPSTLVVAALTTFSVLGAQAEVPTSTPVPSSATTLTQFGVSAATTQDVVWEEVAAPAREFSVVLGTKRETIRVLPYDIRSASVEMWIVDATGQHRVPTPESVTYRGTVEGYPNSRVAVGIWDGGVRGMLWLDSTSPAWCIDPLVEVDPTAPAAKHVVFRETDMVSQGHCGTPSVGGVATTGHPGGVDVLELAEIAIECDQYYMSRRGNNTTTAQNNVTTIMNAVDVIYARDVDITYTITQFFFSVGTDPYNAGSGVDGGTLLGRFAAYWGAARGGVQRDVAHLFSGRNFNGGTLGVAYLRGICNFGNGYGVTDHFSITSTVGRTALVAHELGHNWGSGHCSGSTCRIMCAGLGGCSGNVTGFSSSVINTILAYKSTRGCLSSAAPPTLATVTPNTANTLETPRIILDGTGLSTVTSVRISGTTLTPAEFTIVNDNRIIFTLPEPPAVALGSVFVVGTANSNALPFLYTEVDPPDLITPVAMSVSQQNWNLRCAATPGHAYYMFASLVNAQTVPILGIDFLVNSLQLTTGILDIAGRGEASFPLPPSLAGTVLHAQMVTVDPGLTTLRATPVRSTFVLN